jgi:hypothetical protein
MEEKWQIYCVLDILQNKNSCSLLLHPCSHQFSKFNVSWVSVAYTCNPSYSGGRNQKDHGSKPVWARPYLIKTLHKKELVEWLKV